MLNIKPITADELRRVLFNVENQSMTVADLRKALFLNCEEDEVLTADKLEAITR